MLMTPITHADCFVALARSGDPVRAAALCDTSPAALLSAVQRLETELDGLLFTRLPGALRLSRLGAAWLPLMERLSDAPEAKLPGHLHDPGPIPELAPTHDLAGAVAA
jgi:DNA-binding transcriptional LysR family regulator